MKRERERDN